jgi:predicted Zn-ribbon and HTH transcriptional regulator
MKKRIGNGHPAVKALALKTGLKPAACSECYKGFKMCDIKIPERC